MPKVANAKEHTYAEVLQSVRAAYLDSTEAAKAYYKALPDEEREALLERFTTEVVDVSANLSLLKTFARRRASTPLVAVNLYPWIRKRGFPYEPPDL